MARIEIILSFIMCLMATVAMAATVNVIEEDKFADDDDETQIAKAVIMIPDDPDLMSKFPGLKQFVKKDLPYFHAVELKLIKADRTELRLYNLNGLISETFDLFEWDQEDIDDFLLDYGFFKKNDLNDEVPERYINGTYEDDEDWDHDEL